AGAYNPLLGLSYGEMAAESRSMHKSQGFGVSSVRRPIPEYFKVLDGDPARADILEGIDFSWKRFSNAARLIDLLARAREEPVPEAPERITPPLLDFDRALEDVPDERGRTEKQRDVRELIAACAGLYLEIAGAEPAAVPGGGWKLEISAINRSRAPIR